MPAQRQPQFLAPAAQTINATCIYTPSADDTAGVYAVAYNSGSLWVSCAADCTPAVGDTVACRWVGRYNGSPIGTLLITQVITKAATGGTA